MNTFPNFVVKSVTLHIISPNHLLSFCCPKAGPRLMFLMPCNSPVTDGWRFTARKLSGEGIPVECAISRQCSLNFLMQLLLWFIIALQVLCNLFQNMFIVISEIFNSLEGMFHQSINNIAFFFLEKSSIFHFW